MTNPPKVGISREKSLCVCFLLLNFARASKSEGRVFPESVDILLILKLDPRKIVMPTVQAIIIQRPLLFHVPFSFPFDEPILEKSFLNPKTLNPKYLPNPKTPNPKYLLKSRYGNLGLGRRAFGFGGSGVKGLGSDSEGLGFLGFRM